MDNTPSFLKEIKEEVQVDSLDRLKGLVIAFKEKEALIKTKEEELKKLKESFNSLSAVEIPQLLNANNLSEIKLDTGEKVIVKEDISVTITSVIKYFKFLEKRNEDDIIKLSFSFPSKMDKEKIVALYTFLMENEYEYESEKNVHPATTKKYIKEIIGFKKDDYEEGLKKEKYISKEILMDFLKIFTYYVTKIKE